MTIWKDLKTETIEARLARNRNAGPGFDVLRLVLALLIFYGHARGIAVVGEITNVTTPADQVAESSTVLVVIHNLRHRLFSIYVPVFFALSGFLVTGSALRLQKSVPFLAFRALRIFPALTVEVTLSALILGPLATTYSLQDYFLDPKFTSYLLNIFGIVHFELPGVFSNTTNQYSRVVNANLWTLPAEFYCYLITTLLIVSGALMKRSLFTLLLIFATGALIVKFCFFAESRLDRIAALDVIVYYFFLGMAFFLWKDKIRLNLGLFAVCLVVVLILFQIPGLAFLMPVPLTYATVFFGCLSLKGIDWLRRHDVSYGIYLYGFPITQSLMFFSPAFRMHPLYLTLASISITVMFASLSWHYIEKPALRLKRYIGRQPIKEVALVR